MTAPPAGPPASVGTGRLAVSVYGPSVLFGLGDGAVLPVLPLLATGLGASPARAATILVLSNIGSLLGNLPASVLTARFGERRAIIGAALLGIVAAGCCGLARSVPVLGAGAVLMGISASVFMLARQSYLAEAVPPARRARAMSTLGGVMRIGAFAGPFVAAVGIGVWGLRSAFAVYASALALAAGLAALLPDLPAGRLPDDAVQPGVRAVWTSHRRVFATVGVGVLLVAAVRAARQAVIPLWAHHLGLSPQTP